MCVLYFSENVLSELGILILVLTSALKLIVFSIFHVNVLTENSVRLDKMSQNLSTKEKYFDIKEKYFCTRNLSSFYRQKRAGQASSPVSCQSACVVLIVTKQKRLKLPVCRSLKLLS
jgi:hypothetical protein